MTLPKDKLKKQRARYKRREKKYKPTGWYIGGPYSAHPGLSMGEARTGLLDVIDWSNVPESTRAAMSYELVAETVLRQCIRKLINEID